MTIEMNCDMGEGYGLYKMGDDEGLMGYITVANVACGFHASDPMIMQKTVRLAKEHGVKVGAHPSLPDLQGFGRRAMVIAPQEVTAAIIYQVGALKAFLEAEDMALNHIKPHGALYGMAARDEAIANAVCDAAVHFGVSLYGMANTMHETVYAARGIPLVPEFYADLDYNKNGGLIITREHDPVEPQAAADRVLRVLRESKVKSVEGPDVEMRADTVCVHSDTPNAVEVAQAVRDAIATYQ